MINLCFFSQNGDGYSHVCALVDFGLAMKQSLDSINKHSFNNFHLRVGKNEYYPLLLIKLLNLSYTKYLYLCD